MARQMQGLSWILLLVCLPFPALGQGASQNAILLTARGTATGVSSTGEICTFDAAEFSIKARNTDRGPIGHADLITETLHVSVSDFVSLFGAGTSSGGSFHAVDSAQIFVSPKSTCALPAGSPQADGSTMLTAQATIDGTVSSQMVTVTMTLKFSNGSFVITFSGSTQGMVRIPLTD